MKTVSLFLFQVLLATTVNAQWQYGFQGGLNKTFYPSREEVNGFRYTGTLRSNPAFLTNAYFTSDKDIPVNLGVCIGVKMNHVYKNLSQMHNNGQRTVMVLEHKSAFVSLAPMVDLAIDKKRVLHFLFNPSINIALFGNENGYTKFYNGEEVYYDNTSKNIKRLSLGINAQVQGRYPLNKTLQATASLGYSINNAISRRLPGEAGNASFQLGVIYKMPFSGKKKDKDESEKAKG